MRRSTTAPRRWALAALVLPALLGGGGAGGGYVDAARVRVEYDEGLGSLARYVARRFSPIEGEIVAALGLPAPDERVVVSLHRTDDAFRKALEEWVPSGRGMAFEPWVAGVALVGRGRILLRCTTRNLGDPGGFEAVLGHEIAHLVLARTVRRDNGPHPLWLQEGLAQWATGRIVLGSPLELALAARFGRLGGFAFLESEFPADRFGAALAYLQSESMVRYMALRAGAGGVREILGRMAAGANFYRAFRAVAGVGFYDFEKEWIEHLRAVQLLPWLLVSAGSLFTILTLVGGLGLILKGRKARKMRLRWDEEERRGMAETRDAEGPPGV